MRARTLPLALAMGALALTGPEPTASVGDAVGDANGLHQLGVEQSTDPASYDQADITGLHLSETGDAVEVRLSLQAVPVPDEQPPMMWYGVRATIAGCEWELTVWSGSFAAGPTGSEAGVAATLNDLDGCGDSNHYLWTDPLPVAVDTSDPALVLTVPYGRFYKGLEVHGGQTWTDIWARTAMGNYVAQGGIGAPGVGSGSEHEITVGLDRTAAIGSWTIPVREDGAAS